MHTTTGPRPVAPDLTPAERAIVDRFEQAPDAFAERTDAQAILDDHARHGDGTRPIVTVWGDLTVANGTTRDLGTHLSMIEAGYDDEDRPVQVLAMFAGRLREVDIVREGCTPFDSDDYAYATYALRVRDLDLVVDRCVVRIDGRA